MSLARRITADEVAEAYHVDKSTAIAWMRSGELGSINVSKNRRSKKPVRVTTQEFLDKFDAKRSSVTNESVPRSRKRSTTKAKQYY